MERWKLQMPIPVASNFLFLLLGGIFFNEQKEHGIWQTQFPNPIKVVVVVVTSAFPQSWLAKFLKSCPSLSPSLSACHCVVSSPL